MAKTRKSPRRRAPKPAAAPSMRPPPLAIGDVTGMFVRVPLPPELAEAIGGHVERASAIVELARGLFDVVGKASQAIVTERAALRRTAALVRRRAR